MTQAEPLTPSSPLRSPEPDTPLDLAVVGAGPCGIAVGAAAAKAGLRAVLFDRGALCNSLLSYPYYMSFFSTAEKLQLEALPFATAEKNPTRREALVYFRKVAEYFDLAVHQYENVEAITGTLGAFAVETRTRRGERLRWSARNVVIATGGFHGPNVLGVPGEDLSKVSHHYREPYPFWRQEVLVVGAGNSAVEAVLELFRSGARVTLVHFEETFDPGVKPWILPDIENRIDAGDVAVRWRHRVAEILPGSVKVRSEDTGRVEELANDWVLALTGWKAEPILLRSLDVPIDQETGVPAHDPDTMETPVPGVFIAGVLAAGHDANRIFIENGRWHGQSIVKAIQARSGG